MKRYLFALFTIILGSTHLCAQNNGITQLPCGTWGVNSFGTIEEVYNAKEYKYTHVGYTNDNYKSFDAEWPISFWTPNENSSYLYNIQFIPWEIKDHSIKYHLTIQNIYDVVIYDEPINTCAVALNLAFLKEEVFSIKIEPLNQNTPSPYWIAYRQKCMLLPLEVNKKKYVVTKLNECSSLACKIEVLVKENLLLDALSLLEVEKINNKNDPNIDRMYWKVASIVRLSSLQLSMER